MISISSIKNFAMMNLVINEAKLNQYAHLAKVNVAELPPEHHLAYSLAIHSLTSGQCNEPYERLLSDVLGVVNLEQKHGWDGVDTLENMQEVYEYKPSSNALAPSATINDDSVAKIEKCEHLAVEGKKGWLILAGIDKDNFNFKVIYKFPLDIYTADRKHYLQSTIEKNKEKTKQTRITYGINVKKSITLCETLDVPYYVWQNKM
jgi:hypothetical protein